MNLVLNSKGMVLDIPKSYQLTDGESPNMCTVWTPAALSFAGLPGKGARASGASKENLIDDLAETWWSTHSAGMPADVHWCLEQSVDPTGKQGNLQYRDIPADIANIRAAVRAGYPVIVTANEQNIISKKTGERAYPWSLNENHVFPIGGVDKDGDFICADQLNNSFQGEWPCIYLASRLHPSWACVVQVVGPDPNHPWLAPFPSGNPNAWPANFNAQLFANGKLPNGATDDSSAIHFPNGLVIVKGFRQKYLELVAAGKVPADDVPLVNEYPCHPVEKSDPTWWGTSETQKGSAQETRYFRFGYSPLKGVRVTYVGQEILWYQQQITSAAH